MILTPWFVLGHLPKTGGDAAKQIVKAWQIYGAIPSAGVWVDGVEDPCKHWTFAERVADPALPRVLGIRRLPSWEVSHAQHWALLGDEAGVKHPLPAADQLAERALGEQTLAPWLDGPPIDRWLRCEHLLADLVALFRPYAPCEARLWRVARGTCTKKRGGYDHAREWFTAEQAARLYANSPRWAEIERRVYGPCPA